MASLPPESIAARDSVLYSQVGEGPFRNTTYGAYSPLFPNPITCLYETFCTTALHVYESLPWKGVGPWLAETWEVHYTDCYLNLTNLFHVLLAALIFTIVRYIATETLLKQIPIWLNVNKQEGEKFPEAAFRVGVYTIGWGWTTYVMYQHSYFYEPFQTVIDWIPGIKAPSDIYWLYVFEVGLYLHSIYATLFIEIIRRDFAIQLIHHIVTLLLLIYSFSIRVYGFGVLILFMHDFGDALMELAKCCLYFKIRNGKEHSLPELLANFFFGLFALEWILFRLYWLPVKAMYASGHVSKNFLYSAPHYLLPNLLLWILYALHWYWFYFIAKLIIRVLSGKEVSDNREYDDHGGVRKKEN